MDFNLSLDQFQDNEVNQFIDDKINASNEVYFSNHSSNENEYPNKIKNDDNGDICKLESIIPFND